MQQFFDDVNEKINALSHHSDDKRFSTYLAYFRHHKTNHAKAFIGRRYIDNLNRDIQTLVKSYRNEFSEMARIITQFQSLLNELNNEVNALKAIENSQSAKLFTRAIKKFIDQTYEDIDLSLKAKATADSDTTDVSINNAFKSLSNILTQLKNVTFEKNNVKANLKTLKIFQQQYELNTYLDYLYSIRYPLISGTLCSLTAIFLALYPTTESNPLSHNARVVGLVFTCMSIMSNVAWGYNNARNSLLFHPRHQHANNDLKAVVQEVEIICLQK